MKYHISVVSISHLRFSYPTVRITLNSLFCFVLYCMVMTVLLNKLLIINLFCHIPYPKVCSTVYTSNYVLLLLAYLWSPNIQPQKIFTPLSLSNRKSKIVIQSRVEVICSQNQIQTCLLSFTVEHFLTENSTNSIVVVLIFEMFLHFLNKIHS